MNIPAWQVTSWAPVDASLKDWRTAVRQLRHLGTSTLNDPGDQGLSSGQIVWGVEKVGGLMFGMAWDWREIDHDVIVMQDPMTIITNVFLVDEAGERVSPSKQVVYLNTAIYMLPWQAAITDARDCWVDSMRMAA